VFDLDPAKLAVLAILATVVLGPERIPQAARSLGRMIHHLRSLSENIQGEVRQTLGDEAASVVGALGDLRPAEIRRNVTSMVTGAVAPVRQAVEPVTNAFASPASAPVAPTSSPAQPLGLAAQLATPTPDDPSFN